MNVLQLEKTLSRGPACVDPPPGVTLHNYAGPKDGRDWLQLREAAFAGHVPDVRRWEWDDFCREFLEQPDGSGEQMWLARAAEVGKPLVGSVALKIRDRSPGRAVAIHWLMVAPSRRRQGLATLLLRTAEFAAWQRGRKKIRLQTHRGWHAAVAFYLARGYRQVQIART